MGDIGQDEGTNEKRKRPRAVEKLRHTHVLDFSALPLSLPPTLDLRYNSALFWGNFM